MAHQAVRIRGSSAVQEGCQWIEGKAKECESTEEYSRAIHHAKCYRRRVRLIFNLQGNRNREKKEKKNPIITILEHKNCAKEGVGKKEKLKMYKSAFELQMSKNSHPAFLS